jgi:hypothetical protein
MPGFGYALLHVSDPPRRLGWPVTVRGDQVLLTLDPDGHPLSFCREIDLLDAVHTALRPVERP